MDVNYVLDGPARTCETPPRATDELTAIEEMLSSPRMDRILAMTQIAPDGTTKELDIGTEDGLQVSTVFLMINHQFADHGPPILWETLPFYNGIALDGLMFRYPTKTTALYGHERLVAIIVKRIKAGRQLGQDFNEIVRSMTALEEDNANA